MGKIYKGALELVGNTPLVEFTHIEETEGVEAKILAKLEYFNPAGSVKDRIAKEMIEDAERTGKLKPGSTIIEPTSGNTVCVWKWMWPQLQLWQSSVGWRCLAICLPRRMRI